MQSPKPEIRPGRYLNKGGMLHHQTLFSLVGISSEGADDHLEKESSIREGSIAGATEYLY